MSLDTKLQSLWYGNSRIVWLLLPLSWLFGVIVLLRRWMYNAGWLKIIHVSKPVIVVGNITVGGTGKTPLVIWLAKALSSRGYKVAVIARGYRGAAATWPQVVTKESDPDIVGDEPVLIAQLTGVTVVAGPDRVADARRAIELGADLIVSDDGLQHYRLQRDCEIAVMDGSRMLGNNHLLPAGPLRESSKRLQRADLLLINRRAENAIHKSTLQSNLQYHIVLNQLRSLKTDERRSLDILRDQQVHVVTGIGNPQAFIAALQAQGIRVLPRLLGDHAKLAQQDIRFGDALPVLMTAKDAVKCGKLDVSNCWVVDAEAMLDDATAVTVLDRIQAAIRKSA